MAQSDLIVVGGGITGLSSAYIAAKSGLKVTLIEANTEFGGLLSTFEIAGSRLEHYYHHFFTHDAELNWLIKDLGIEDKLFFRKTSMGVFRNGKIYPFNSLGDLIGFKPISFLDKIRFGVTSLFLGKLANWRKYEDISCWNWFEKYSGQSTTSTLWAPMLKIKFGPFAKQVPLAWMIGRMRQRFNSRKRGDERLGYLEGSLQTLKDALIRSLTEMGVEMINEAPVEEIKVEGNKMIALIANGDTYRAKDYLFTIPGIPLKNIIEPHSKLLAEKIGAVNYFGAVCVILELKRPLSDIYWLNVADEGFPFGGVIEHTNFIDSAKYQDSHLVYLSRYYSKEENIRSMSNEEVKELMLEALPRIYQDFDNSWLKSVHVFRTNTAATVCDLNFSEKVFDCRTSIEGLHIANMTHIYPDERSTNNSIRVAAEACKVLGIESGYVPKNSSLSALIGF